MIITVCACSNKKTFEAEIEFPGLATQNIEILAIEPEGISRQSIAAIDGHLSFTSNASNGAVVEMYTRGGNFLGRFYAERGDKIKATVNNPVDFTIKGNKTSESLAQFLKGKVITDTLTINRAVTQQIEKTPGDKLSLILFDYYFTQGIDNDATLRLIDLLEKNGNTSGNLIYTRQSIERLSSVPSGINWDTKMVVPGDTVEHPDFTTHKATLLYIAPFNRRGDTISQSILDSIPSEIHLTVVRTYVDSVGWENSRSKIKRNGISFFWAPGGMAHPAIYPLNLPEMPYWVAVDSTSSEISRSSDPLETIHAVTKKSLTQKNIH